MRNLKRALSLALASVMLVGMMVVGTSAASYPDVDSNDNVEAISVLQAVGVMQGDGDTGEFRPDSEVSRNEMAVIMARLLLGPDADDYVGTHPFTDVPAWADKYVAACYNDGIIKGMDETTYGGKETVTAQQAAAMMLRALGYEKLESTGSDWARRVVQKANEISLFKDVGSNPNAAMTRNQIAQLGLNTLEATMVTTESGTNIDLGDIGSITTDVKYIDREVEVSTGKNVYAIALNPEANATGTATKYTLQLGEWLYDGDLKKEAPTAGTDDDDFGRVASSVWSMNNDKVYTNSDSPVATFTADTSAGDVAKALRGYKFQDNTTNTTYYNVNDNDKLASGATTNAKTNGSGTTSLTSGQTVAKTISLMTANGKLVEIYADGNSVITNIVTVAYNVTEVSSVTEGKNGTTYRLDSGESGIIYNEDQDKDDTIVISGDIAEDDVVTYAVSKDGKTLYVYATTSFTGTQTSRNNSKNTIVVDGTTYDTAIQTTNDANFPNEEGTFYVDQYGFVVKSDAVAAETNWAVLNEIAGVTNVGGGLSTSQSAEAQLFFPDGTKATVKVVKIGTVEAKNFDIKTESADAGAATYTNGKVNDIDINIDSTKNDNLQGRIVKYSVKNNEYTLDYADVSGTSLISDQTGAVKSSDGNETASVTTKGVPSFNVDGSNTSYSKRATANNNTIYIIKKDDEDFDHYVGFKNVPDVTTTNQSKGVNVAYAMDDGKVAVVYLDAYVDGSATGSVAGSSSDIFYVTNKDYSSEKVGDDTVYVLEGILNGELAEIRTEDEAKFTSLNKGDLVKLTLDGDGYVTATPAASDYTAQDISAAKEEADGLVAGLTYDDDTKVYVIDDDDVEEGTVKSAKAGDKVYIKVKGASGADKDTIEIMYVIKDAAAAAKNVLGTPTKPDAAVGGLTVASVAVTKDDTDKTAVNAGDDLAAGTYRVVVTLSGAVTADTKATVTLAGVSAIGTAAPTDASKITVNTGASAPTATTYVLVKDAEAASGTEIVFKFTVAEAAAGTGTTNITPAVTITTT